MALSVLNNISALAARNELAITQGNLQTTLFRLSSGKKINSGADDAAGLAIADGLHANVTALQQSAQNANNGVGKLQVADGALSQVTTLLNRAVTLATEAATGTVTSSQQSALNTEFQAIHAEINRIGTDTTFNGSSVFTSSTTSIFLSDANSQSTITVTVGALSTTAISLTGTSLTSAANAATSLTAIANAVSLVAADRGALGATINRLNSAVNVINNQVQNLTSAEDGIRSADIAQEVGNLSKYQILNQTGISALAQANQSQQQVLKLLQ
jgi:flagellin